MSELKKILIITTFAYPHQGGLSSHIDLLKKGYEEQGVGCEVLSLNSLTGPEKFIRKIFASPFYFLNKGVTFYVFQLLTCFFLKRKINRLKEIYSILHFHEVSPLVKKSKDFKVILTVHADFTNFAIGDGLFDDGSTIAKRYYRIEKESYANANLIIAVDERIKQYIENTSGRTDVVKQINFVDAAEFDVPTNFDKEQYRRKYNIPADKKIIICPRRLVKKNGVIYASYLLKELPARFVVVYVGDGPELDAIQEYAKENDLVDRVFFFKHIYREEMKYFYWLSDYVIVPSVTVANGMQEATSIAAIEGMASGRIVLASAIGGLKELINSGYNGFLFEEKQVKDIQRKILTLETDGGEKETVMNNAKYYVRSELDYKAAVKKITNKIMME